jgi:hypothetical protein
MALEAWREWLLGAMGPSYRGKTLFDSASTCAEVDEDVEEEDDVDHPLSDYAYQACPEAEGNPIGTQARVTVTDCVQIVRHISRRRTCRGWRSPAMRSQAA